jgi:hypothetical protein
MLLFLFYNLKIITQTLHVPNVLLDCAILFYYLVQLELFVAFSKVNGNKATTISLWSQGREISADIGRELHPLRLVW